MMFLFVTFLIPFTPDSTYSEFFTGFAYDLETEELLYSEEHKRTFHNGNLTRGEVVYRDAHGGIIATKTLNFDASLIAPDFRLEDKRYQLVEGAERKSTGVSLINGKANNLSSKPIQTPLSPALVIDAGFDYFVKQNWVLLSQNAKVEFLFGSPSEQRVFKFQLELIKKEAQETGTRLYLQMKPSSKFLQWLVDPIELCYIKAKGDPNVRLEEYKGITNINRSSKEKYRALIRFPPQT